MSSSIVFKNKSDYLMKFNTKNIPLSMINGLRRIIYSDIETYCFGNFNFIQNNTILHDEYIGHRISLIPIMRQDDFDEKEIDDLEFTLDIENNSTEHLNVYTDDIKCNKEFTNIPKRVPITILKPNEKINIKFSLVYGNGKEHAKFIPVSVAVFRNIADIIIDEKKELDDEEIDFIVNSCPKKIIKKNKKNIKVEDIEKCIFCKSCVKSSEVIDIEDLIKIDKKTYYSEPIFEMKIESKCQYTTMNIMRKACDKLIELLTNGKQLFEDDQDNYLLPNLKHTFANLVTEYLRRNPNVIYSGYKVPHPLYNYIVLQIKCKNEDSKQSLIIKNTIEKIIKKIKKVKKEFQD